MNTVEHVLKDDLTGLLDRLAAAVPGATLERIAAAEPALRARLDDAEAHLGAVRASLLETYGAWRQVLSEVEELWVEGAWRSVAPPAEAGEQAAVLAA